MLLGLARVQSGMRASDNGTMKDEDGAKNPTFRERAGRAALVGHEDTVGRAVGIHQQGRRAGCSGSTRTEGRDSGPE